MIQFLNNIWIALTNENAELVSLLVLPLHPLESILVMYIFLIIFNISANLKQKSIYVITTTLIGIITLNFIPSPFNVFINYISMLLLIKFIFKLNWLKSLISLILPIFVVALLNILFQQPYQTFLNIDSNILMNTPLYRILYLVLIYSLGFIICILLNKFKNRKVSFDYIDNMDHKTIVILCLNLFIGFLTLCLQLITSAFYIDIVPVIISILNFILLISFLILSIFSFTRILKLANTKKDLANAEDYNKSLEILYDEVKGFKHDFDNIVSTLDGFIEIDDMVGLKQYFNEVKKDCKITNNLSIINPRTINNPGIYSLLNNKYFKATNSGVNFDINYFIDLNNIDINLYHFSRILGILLDNAIEEAQLCENKLVKISFIRETRNNRAVITIKNTYSNKDVNTEKIFEKGLSGKEHHSGIGLWEVRNYINKNKNLDLFTTKNNNFFIQELSIYDLQKK